jgi:hypothetical protein
MNPGGRMNVLRRNKKRRRRYKMTAYESLKRKENVLREASLRAEAPDMKSMWFEKSRELQKKIGEMTIEEAEKEYKKWGILV